MTIDRSRRVLFDQVAELYDEVRPRYPDALIEDVLALSDLPADGRILEVGPGPGNATLPFARRGYRMLCIELGPRLAALAAAHCRPYPNVQVRQGAFEAWELEEGAFDLVLSAEAFHWIPPQISYPKAARALKDTGALALFWTVMLDPGTALSRALGAVYREVAPSLENPLYSPTAEWLIGQITGNFRACGCFGPVTVRQYDMCQTYDTARYLKLIRTFSSHRALDPETRAVLLARTGAAVERHGGQVVQPYRVVLFHARVRR